MKALLYSLVAILVLSGCHRHKKQVAPFPVAFALKSYTVVNHIPRRSGGDLGYLLRLDEWGRTRIKPRGLSGEGVLSLIEGAVDLVSTENGKNKQLAIDIVVAFEVKNVPAYGYRKMYFRLSERLPVSEKDIQNIEVHLKRCLKQLDQRLYYELSAHLGGLFIETKVMAHDKSVK